MLSSLLRQGVARLALSVLLLWLAGAGSANAQINITEVLYNGAATASVTSPGTFSLRITGTFPSGFDAFSISTTPGSAALEGCYKDIGYTGPGTYSRTFLLQVPATGTYTVSIRAYPNNNCSAQGSNIFTTNNALTVNTVSLNHVRIEHDGKGATCAPETITLRACTDAACATPFTGSVVVDLGNGAGTWSADPVTISGGSTTVALTNGAAGAVTLSGVITSPAASDTTANCYQNGVLASCQMTFEACSLQAVEPGAGAGGVIFTKRAGATTQLDVLTLVGVDPYVASTQQVTARLVADAGGTCGATFLSDQVTQTYASGSNGRLTFDFTPYRAAANVRVQMTSGALTACSTDNFAIRPDAFSVSTTVATADAAGLNAAAATTLRAGAGNFDLVASSRAGYTGTPVLASARLATSQPAPAVAGTIAGVFGAAPVGTGTASGSAFTYSEVGYVRLLPYAVYDTSFTAVDSAKGECFSATLGGATAPADPNVADASGRIGCYFGSQQTSFLGRFIPDHFAVSATSLLNRSAIAVCSARAFSYMGEPLSTAFTLQANNAAGVKTANYTGAFARFTPATQSDFGIVNDPASGARTVFPVCGASPGHPCFSLGASSGTFSAGIAPVVTALTVLRGASAVGPYPSLKIGIAPVDLDGVMLKPAALTIDTVNTVAAPGVGNHAALGTTDLRYGRMKIDNAYGSELLNLPLNVAAQYWNGSGYAANALDSCSPLATAQFSLDTYAGGINAVNLPVAKLTGGSTMVNGIGRLTLAKPTPAPATKGSVKVTGSSAYLPGSGRATFGVYKSGPIIYVRETY